jgi:hypothetical protein
MTTFSRQTGQHWKLKLLYVLVPATVLTVFPSISPLRILGLPPDDISIIGVLVGLGTLGWIAFALRCPRCSLRLGLWFMKNRSPLAWYTQFLDACQCPGCGYRPG